MTSQLPSSSTSLADLSVSDAALILTKMAAARVQTKAAADGWVDKIKGWWGGQKVDAGAAAGAGAYNAAKGDISNWFKDNKPVGYGLAGAGLGALAGAGFGALQDDDDATPGYSALAGGLAGGALGAGYGALTSAKANPVTSGKPKPGSIEADKEVVDAYRAAHAPNPINAAVKGAVKGAVTGTVNTALTPTVSVPIGLAVGSEAYRAARKWRPGSDYNKLQPGSGNVADRAFTEGLKPLAAGANTQSVRAGSAQLPVSNAAASRGASQEAKALIEHANPAARQAAWEWSQHPGGSIAGIAGPNIGREITQPGLRTILKEAPEGSYAISKILSPRSSAKVYTPSRWKTGGRWAAKGLAATLAAMYLQEQFGGGGAPSSPDAEALKYQAALQNHPSLAAQPE